MAETSALTRYRPAAVAVVGVAAALGIYLLYSSGSHPSEKAGLHRSNAVHRPRGDRPRPAIDLNPPDSEAPLGYMTIRSGSNDLVINIAQLTFPTEEQMRRVFGQPAGEVYAESMILAVHAILRSCLKARSPSSQQELINAGLGEIRDAVMSQDFERCSSLLAGVLPTVDRDIIDRALRQFLRNEFHSQRGDTSSEADTGEVAATENLEGLDDSPEGPGEGIKQLLYFIAEEQAHRKAYEHRGIICEECGENPIRGVRFHCLNCPDYDLCSTCEAQSGHLKTHVFAKVKIPLPVLSQPSRQYPIWYPGDPRKTHSPLSEAAKQRLAEHYRFDKEKIVAFYDQFTCFANVSWPADPVKVYSAIDKRAFIKAVTSERWEHRFAPNAVFDRMFAFYDTNSDGLIGFEEFVSGLAYLRGPIRFVPVIRALRGFDIDGDELLSRADFLRLFRAKYAIQAQLINDMVEAYETDQTLSAGSILQSSQPISSVFHEEDIPRGEDRPRRGKRMDDFGDMQPLPGAKMILDEDDPWPQEERRQRRTITARGAASHERLRDHLLRFEEILDDPAGNNLFPQDANTPNMSPSATESVLRDSSHEQLQSLGFDVSADNESDYLPNQGILSQILEEGLNETLDRMFKAKEQLHRDAIQTRAERARWRTEIDMALREKQTFLEELRAAVNMPPHIAAAVDATASIKAKQRSAPSSGDVPEPAFRGDIVPTDSESLSRREEEIAQRPLEELLSATGYGTIESPEQGQAPGVARRRSTSATDDSSTYASVSGRASAGSHHTSADPTLPQNRPNSVSTTDGLEEKGDLPATASLPDSAQPPSRQRLEYLASMEDADHEIQRRGGPGRLSFDEIHVMVHQDTTRELHGLVTNWLEWASF